MRTARTTRFTMLLSVEEQAALHALAAADGETPSVKLRRLIRESAKAAGVPLNL